MRELRKPYDKADSCIKSCCREEEYRVRREIATGWQDFESLRMNDRFYVDKTDLIREWWMGGDAVTLITRPRRFGKSLLVSTMEAYFSGRKDFQVKIMGRRIELEEVEYVLNQMQGVDRSCCVVDQKRKLLMAYYCGAADRKMLRSQMRKRLPDYMIPKKIIRVKEIPLNKNGKTDRAQLLANY